jgi:hypothetical protein
MCSASEAWLPKSVVLLGEYSTGKFAHDLIAGVTVGYAIDPIIEQLLEVQDFDSNFQKLR